MIKKTVEIPVIICIMAFSQPTGASYNGSTPRSHRGDAGSIPAASIQLTTPGMCYPVKNSYMPNILIFAANML